MTPWAGWTPNFDDTPVGEVFGYRNRVWWVAPFNMALFAIVATVMTASSLTTGSPPIGFVAGWVAILAGNGYWFLFRIGYQLDVDGATVTWRAPLRRRSVPLSDIEGNGAIWFGFPRLRVRLGRSLLIAGGPGWVDFLAALATVCPTADIAPTTTDRLAARWPLAGRFRSGFYVGTRP